MMNDEDYNPLKIDWMDAYNGSIVARLPSNRVRKALYKDPAFQAQQDNPQGILETDDAENPDAYVKPLELPTNISGQSGGHLENAVKLLQDSETAYYREVHRFDPKNDDGKPVSVDLEERLDQFLMLKPVQGKNFDYDKLAFEAFEYRKRHGIP